VRHKRWPGAGDAGPKVDCGSLGKPAPPSTESPKTRQVFASVYDGQRCIGFLLARGRSGCEAFTAAEQSLGIYRDQEYAALAVYAAFDDGGAR